MYINLSPEKTVRKSDVVGFFDLDTGASTKATKDFLKKAEKEGRTVSAGSDIPKSFVLLRDGTVVFSQYSSKILLRRTSTRLGF